MNAEETCTIGQRLRMVRRRRGLGLAVAAGLAGHGWLSSHASWRVSLRQRRPVGCGRQRGYELATRHGAPGLVGFAR